MEIISASNESEPPVRSRSRVRPLLIVALVVWVAAVGFGMKRIWRYENTPGLSFKSPSQWPANSRIARAPDGATLVLLAHPKCPCTRATLGELAEIMAHSDGRLRAYVLFLKPKGMADGWEKTDLWESAAKIPGVTVLSDEDGREAQRFGVATSGEALLYDADGHLLFTGGITSARGHAGDNAGRSAIIALVDHSDTTTAETAVFGCPLFDPNKECPQPDHDSK
jgi:hypothetical protein